MNRSRLLGVFGAVGAMLLAGCGAGASASAGAASGGSVPGVTKDAITFGMVTPLSGAQSALGLDGRAGAEALIGMINASGGVNGRQIKLEVQDDQYDPQHAVAGAKYFASQSPVFAIWGNIGTATTLAGLPVYESANLPLLFPEAFTAKLNDWKWAFREEGSFGEEYKVLSDALAATASGHKYGFLYQNDGTSVESLTGFKQGSTPVTDAEPFERTANTYATQIQKLKAAGVTDVQFIGNPAQIAIALKESDSIGYKPQWWGSLGVTSPDTFKLAGPLAEGVYTVNFASSPNADTPGAQAFRDAMAKYQPNATASGFALNNWIGGLMIVDALKRAGNNPTRESFVKALESTSNLDMGGLLPPVTLTPQDHTANRCLQILEAQNQKFVQHGDWLCPKA